MEAGVGVYRPYRLKEYLPQSDSSNPGEHATLQLDRSGNTYNPG